MLILRFCSICLLSGVVFEQYADSSLDARVDFSIRRYAMCPTEIASRADLARSFAGVSRSDCTNRARLSNLAKFVPLVLQPDENFAALCARSLSLRRAVCAMITRSFVRSHARSLARARVSRIQNSPVQNTHDRAHKPAVRARTL